MTRRGSCRPCRARMPLRTCDPLDATPTAAASLPRPAQLAPTPLRTAAGHARSFGPRRDPRSAPPLERPCAPHDAVAPATWSAPVLCVLARTLQLHLAPGNCGARVSGRGHSLAPLRTCPDLAIAAQAAADARWGGGRRWRVEQGRGGAARLHKGRRARSTGLSGQQGALVGHESSRYGSGATGREPNAAGADAASSAAHSPTGR
jgi:hypothetical protein